MSAIRPLALGDVEELSQLLRECWLDTYKGILAESVIEKAIKVWQSPERLRRGMENSGMYFAGYFVDGRLVGMVSAGKLDEHTLKIFQLYVHPAYQRRGIGGQLMDTAIDRFRESRRVVLEVEEGNKKGITFYKKYGFDYPERTNVKINGDEIACLVGKLDLRRQ